MGWPFGRQRGRHVARHAGSAGAVPGPQPVRPDDAGSVVQPTPAVAIVAPAGAEVVDRPPAVQLGFRDGSSYDVPAESAQGRALRAIADVIVTATDPA